MRLLEVALIDKHGHASAESAKLMDQRLAEVLSPKGLSNNQTQLNVIDQYLSMRNGEAVIAEALNVIKPVFMAQVEKKFEQEGNELLQKFGINENQTEVLTYYFYNKEHPNEMKSGAWRRFMTFSVEREMYDRVQSLFPMMTAQS